MKYLIFGLESSCTRIVAKIIAKNLGLIESLDDWDGHNDIDNGVTFVSHRSMPHEFRDNYITPEFTNNFNYVILVTRDWNCSLKSKINNHHPDPEEARKEHLRGVEYIKNIIDSRKIFIFSYETSFLLQEKYTIPFLKSLGIKNPVHIDFENANEKYMIG